MASKWTPASLTRKQATHVEGGTSETAFHPIRAEHIASWRNQRISNSCPQRRLVLNLLGTGYRLRNLEAAKPNLMTANTSPPIIGILPPELWIIWVVRRVQYKSCKCPQKVLVVSAVLGTSATSRLSTKQISNLPDHHGWRRRRLSRL